MDPKNKQADLNLKQVLEFKNTEKDLDGLEAEAFATAKKDLLATLSNHRLNEQRFMLYLAHVFFDREWERFLAVRFKVGSDLFYANSQMSNNIRDVANFLYATHSIGARNLELKSHEGYVEAFGEETDLNKRAKIILRQREKFSPAKLVKHIIEKADETNFDSNTKAALTHTVLSYQEDLYQTGLLLKRHGVNKLIMTAKKLTRNDEMPRNGKMEALLGKVKEIVEALEKGKSKKAEPKASELTFEEALAGAKEIHDIAEGTSLKDISAWDVSKKFLREFEVIWGEAEAEMSQNNKMLAHYISHIYDEIKPKEPGLTPGASGEVKGQLEDGSQSKRFTTGPLAVASILMIFFSILIASAILLYSTKNLSRTRRTAGEK